MNNCDTCFSHGWITCFAEAMGIDRRDCQLTEAYQRIVEVMVTGKWRCDTCGTVKCNHLPEDCACELWRPRKEDGDAS